MPPYRQTQDFYSEHLGESSDTAQPESGPEPYRAVLERDENGCGHSTRVEVEVNDSAKKNGGNLRTKRT